MTTWRQKAEYIRDLVGEIAAMAESESRLEFLGYLLRMAQTEAVNRLNSKSNKLCG
jgi:hypothetical protein